MKRWLLPTAQLIVALAIIPQALLCSAVLGLPILLSAPQFVSQMSGPAGRFLLAGSVTCFFVVAAAVLCLFSGVALLIPSQSHRGVRLSIAGAICYWIYVASHLAMISTTTGGLRYGLTVWWNAIDFVIAIIVASVSFAIYASNKKHAALD